jgi:hypothetical protein
MYLETYTGYNLLNGRENFVDMDSTSVTVLVLYSIWLLLWVFTIYNAITKKSKNKTVSLLISVLSWPFYWIFKMYKVI